MSLSQAGRQAINPITGEQRFPQDFRRSQEAEIAKVSSESRRLPPQQEPYVPPDRGQFYEQIQTLESKLLQELRRTQKSLAELERDVRLRPVGADVSCIISSQSTLQVDDLQNRIYQLETKLISQERSRNELGSRVAQQDQNLKELMYYIKNTQNKETNEALQMRGMIQEKITEENSNLMKEREKMKALFMEVGTPLGEQVERHSETLSTLNQQYEQRLMGVEAKIYNGEKALIQVAQRGDTGMNFINESHERVEKRVMSLEANLLALGKDQLKDHDQISRVDSANLRLQEDLKQMLQMIQQDYQTRLDNRVTELINRIVMEHEQRVKTIDEMKQNQLIKDQMNNERLAYEREELKEKLFSLEQYYRADSLKKDEAIKQLQTVIETQINAIFMNIQNEEAQRYQHEIQLRSELLKIQENIKNENDLFKQHQASITEKITDMIRVEVQNRLTSDVDLKNLTSAIATDIVSDLNQLKDQIDMQTKSIFGQLSVQEKENAERAERLSLYIDDEINKAVKTSSQKYDKVKQIFQKFAEQFKQHIVGNDGFRMDVDQRLKILESNHEVVRTDFQNALDDLQEHLLKIISNEKNDILQQTASTFQLIEDKVNKINEEQFNKFRVLKEAVEENHQLITDKIKLILEQNETFQQETRGALKALIEAFGELKEMIIQIQKDQEVSISQLSQKIVELQQQIDELSEQSKQLHLIDNEIKATIQTVADDLKVRGDQLDELQLKLEDLQRQDLKRQDEIRGLKDSQVLLRDTIEKYGETLNHYDEKLKVINENFQQQQGELKQMEESMQKLNEELALMRQKDLADFAKELGAFKQENVRFGDQQIKFSDELKKMELQVQELKQSVGHLQENVKSLAKLPN